MRKAYESPTLETTRLSIVPVICVTPGGDDIIGDSGNSF